jgi:hypothetical protein
VRLIGYLNGKIIQINPFSFSRQAKRLGETISNCRLKMEDGGWEIADLCMKIATSDLRFHILG